MMADMDISIDTQFRGFGVNVNAKFEFAKKVKVDSSSITFIAYATVENSSTSTAPKEDTNGQKLVRLTDTALDLATNNIDEFYRIYGDSYVSAIYSGAELVVSMVFSVQTKTEGREIEAGLTGSGWGFSGDAKFQQTLKKYSEQSKLTMSYYQSGGAGDDFPLDLTAFMEKIGKLPSLALDSPRAFYITLKRFDSLPNWPQTKLPVRSSVQEQMTR